MAEGLGPAGVGASQVLAPRRGDRFLSPGGGLEGDLTKKNGGKLANFNHGDGGLRSDND